MFDVGRFALQANFDSAQRARAPEVTGPYEAIAEPAVNSQSGFVEVGSAIAVELVSIVKRQLSEDFLSKNLEIWIEATDWVSSTRDMVEDVRFAPVKAHSGAAVDALVRRLRAGDVRPQLFTALAHLTGQNPAAPADKGYVYKLADAWLAWADRGA